MIQQKQMPQNKMPQNKQFSGGLSPIITGIEKSTAVIQSSKLTRLSITTAACVGMMLLSGCASLESRQDKNRKNIEPSYLINTSVTEQTADNTLAEADNGMPVMPGQTSLTRVPSLAKAQVGFNNDDAIADGFSATPSLTIAADNMPLTDFLHYTFGDLLQSSYVLGGELSDLSSTVTLNIQNEISPKKLYSLTEKLLLERGVGIMRQNDVLYISLITKEGSDSIAVGYGRKPSTVPNALNVQQIVPLRYTINNTTIKTLRDIAGVKATADIRQGVMFISGRREQVIRALDLLSILDAPGSRSGNIGFLKLTFIDTDTFIDSITNILVNEGIMTGANTADNRVSLVPISQLGAVAVFASEPDFIQRIEFWAKQLDQPAKGNEKQYFVYTPKFARASDLGESVSALISGRSASTQKAERASTDKAAAIENRAPSTTGTSSASNENINMVVDERSNALIFYSSGPEYQAILPLVARLDVMPKQVILEVSIAEVTLTDEFKFGVDMAFSSGKFSFSNTHGAADIGGSVLSWASGGNKIDAQAFESNKWVNVLSKPSLLVRDGVAASIQVGTDIPVVGKTTTDPVNGVTKSIDYRKTGIDVTVTPTINAQGVVIMTIQQNNSNQVDGGADVEGNPQIFERSIDTEVVAESGQTVILGGLISENATDNQAGLPWVSKLPLIGALFGTTTQNTVRTELVIMVTPKVITRTDEWDDIKSSLTQGLKYLELN
ncbi:hypothetical protein TUM4438_34380 [Shewanella sairae]|uniref:NolW-like domain-containing protein n=1 Tax=Shewanella sairae TaxID=190310 RepID=A0ABQ4PN81_9GAMM|nr:secretin N-terminal domain-containing protein [Shewanella sairae]MCL1131404.1 general secretion pathway protein GspD [Shewanella sairae]GIU49862.1 hypothetical protein TUM4438_34380 [Shewanella sairae]